MKLNMNTGVVLTGPGKIKTPMGTIPSPVLAERSGFYTTKKGVLAANLYGMHQSFAGTQEVGVRLESDINKRVSISAEGETVSAGETEEVQVPRDLTSILLVLGLLVVLSELFYIKWRGDL